MDPDKLDDLDHADEPQETEALTDWENPPSLADLKQDLTDVTPDHSIQVSKIDSWLANLNITGAAKIKPNGTNSAVQPKVIRKQAEWRYAALSEPFLSTDDVFNAEAATYEDTDGAEQVGIVLNHQFNNQLGKVEFIDEYVRTVVDEGTAIVRVGWEFIEEEVTEHVAQFEYHPTDDPETLQLIQELAQMSQAEPGRFAGLPVELRDSLKVSLQRGVPHKPVKIGMEEVTRTKTVSNKPTLEVCAYQNTFVDPTCNGDIDKAGFIIYSFETSLSQLQKEGKYQNLDKINVEGNSVLSAPDHVSQDESSFTFSDEPRKKIVAYEYWGYWDYDKTGEVKPFVATWVGDVLIRMEESPFPDKKLPFVSVQYLPVRKSVYGEPDGELLEDNQKIIGAVTRGMIDIMARSANGQMGSRKDALDVTNKRKFDRGEDYEFNAQVDPRQAFHMHTFPEIPQSASLMLQLQNADADSLTGIKAFSGGITGTALGDNVGGIKTALDATAKREMGILRRLADGIRKIGLKIAAMNQEFLDEEETIRITADKFVTIRRDNLTENFDLVLSISTPEADEQKASELAFMLQTLGPNEDPGLRKMLLSNIAKLRKMPELAHKLEVYEPQPDPMAQRKAELEIALLEAQIETERSKAVENYKEAELDAAKARDLLSTADKRDLDYVEQESGVTQERDLQKMGEQAKANAQLKMVEHALKKDEQVAEKTTATPVAQPEG